MDTSNMIEQIMKWEPSYTKEYLESLKPAELKQLFDTLKRKHEQAHGFAH